MCCVNLLMGEGSGVKSYKAEKYKYKFYRVDELFIEKSR
jgi:hypothetical protein